MAAYSVLFMAALMAAVHVRLLGADYTLQVMLRQYLNEDHIQLADNATTVCCKGSAPAGSCTEDCNNQIFFCVRPTGTDSGCLLGNHTTQIIPRDHIGFDSDDSMYYMPRPLEFNGTIWTGSVQLYIRVEDIEDMGSDLVTEFFINIAVDPGTEFTSGDISLGIHSGTLSNTVFILRYRVLCVEDFFGPNCATFCQDTDSELGHYTCDENGTIVCNEGYRNTSTNCTEPCTPATGCSDAGGYCAGPNSCICRPFYAGSLCDMDLDPCGHTMPCENGATCMNSGDGDFNCTCAEGFDGERCLIPTDECDPDPCQNGATCMDLFLNYRCECVPGYGGTNCELDIDECAEHSCSNGGTCQDELADYVCECPAGFQGKNCTEESEDSSSSSGVDVGVVAGAAVTGVLLLIIIILVVALVLVLRRKPKKIITTSFSKHPPPATQHAPLFTQSSQLTELLPMDVAPGKNQTIDPYHKFENPLYAPSTEQGKTEYSKRSSTSPPPHAHPGNGNGHYSAEEGAGGIADEIYDDNCSPVQQGGIPPGKQQPYQNIDSPEPQSVPPGKQQPYQNVDSPAPQGGVPPGRRKQQYQNIDSPPPPPIGSEADRDWGVGANHDYDYAETAGERQKPVAVVMPLPERQPERTTEVVIDTGKPAVFGGVYEEPFRSKPPHHNYATLDGPSPPPPVHKYDYVDNVGFQAELEPPHDYDYADPKPYPPAAAAQNPGPSAVQESWPYEIDVSLQDPVHSSSTLI